MINRLNFTIYIMVSRDFFLDGFLIIFPDATLIFQKSLRCVAVDMKQDQGISKDDLFQFLIALQFHNSLQWM